MILITVLMRWGRGLLSFVIYRMEKDGAYVRGSWGLVESSILPGFHGSGAVFAERRGHMGRAGHGCPFESGLLQCPESTWALQLVCVLAPYPPEPHHKP